MSNTHLAPWVTSAEFHEMCRKFCQFDLRIGEYDAVVGIPRSGMVPASMAALTLGVPLWAMGKHGPEPLATGRRLQYSKIDQRKVKRLLILDDSSASGQQMSLVKKAMQLPHLRHYEVTYAAVIVTPSGRRNVDMYHEVIELPHWFEWNFFGNTDMVKGFKVVAELEVMRDEYWELETTVPRFTHVPTIISDEPDTISNVNQTVGWLDRNDITYDSLLHRPKGLALDSYKHVRWKVETATRKSSGLFVTDHPEQAGSLTAHKYKCVLCPKLGKSLLRPIGEGYDP